MPIFNVTVDDVSPLIQYSGWWGDSSHADDLWSSYSNGTFHATDQLNASATLTFNGSAIYLVGARRPNHDQYTVTLDGSSTVANGNPGSNIFGASLYSASGMDTSQHQLVLRNTYTTATSSWVDVDYIVFTSGDGNADTVSTDIVWDDSDPNANITYTGAWETSPNGFEGYYYQQTMHRTNMKDASASVIFYGNSISLYGCTASNHGLFSVILDGGNPLILNGTAPVGRYQLMLYYSGGLSNDLHNLTIINTDDNGAWFDLDMVKVSTWGGISNNTVPGPAKPSGTGNPVPGDHAPQGTMFPTGAVAGGITAGVVVLLIIVPALFMFFRRRQRSNGADIEHPDTAPKETILPTDASPGTIEPFPYLRNGNTTPGSLPDVNNYGSSLHITEYVQGYPKRSLLRDLAPSSTNVDTIASGPSSSTQETPHRDFPPPDYEEATGALRRS